VTAMVHVERIAKDSRTARMPSILRDDNTILSLADLRVRRRQPNPCESAVPIDRVRVKRACRPKRGGAWRT
jgi:hypothetical protein